MKADLLGFREFKRFAFGTGDPLRPTPETGLYQREFAGKWRKVIVTAAVPSSPQLRSICSTTSVV